jgi:tRNA(fMet)-specific endonuclease VapC
VAAISVLACDAGTALHYGKLKKDLKEKGKPLPENDIWIAAIAKQHNLAIASRDQHFKEIGSVDVAVW